MNFAYNETYHLGLIGKKLDYSYSKIIHEKYMDCSYDLIEIKDENELTEFFKNFGYDGVNVTNPYKKAVIKYLDALDDIASITNSVNTIVNHNGKLVGYNTDYFGFEYLLRINKIDIKNKKIYILGNGGVVNTLLYSLKNNDVTLVTRKSIESNIKNIRYEELNKHSKNIDIMINATPVGINPNIFDINENVKEVLENNPSIITIDLNYNPNVSYFCSLTNRHYNGLLMLIKQAIVANNLMTDRIEEYDINLIEKDLIKYNNYAIIGMMGVGKTTYGKTLAQNKKLKFIDIDEEIERREEKTISDIFKEKGEKYFRDLEEKVTIEYAMSKGYVISCGGGIVLNSKAMEALAAYSYIILIDSKIEDIIQNINKDLNKRPLATNEEEIRKIYKDRKNLYKKYAMKIVKK